MVDLFVNVQNQQIRCFLFFTKNSLELSVFDLLKVDVYGKSGVQSVQSLTLTHLFIKYV